MIRRLPLAGLLLLVLVGAGMLLMPSFRAKVPASHPAQSSEGAAGSGAANSSPFNAVKIPTVHAAAPTATAAVPSASPMPVLTPGAAPVPQAMQGVADIDPHQTEGSKSAPVIMEVFSDYQCPACKTLYLSTDRLLVDNYVNTGKVFLIHRDFPLPMHAYSRVAARNARAAAQLGKLQAVAQALFQNQEKWEASGDVDGTVASALTPAEMNKVRALVKGGTMDTLIDKDYALGQINHITQTPTTILHVNGQTYPVAGVVTFDTLHTFLDQLLGQK